MHDGPNKGTLFPENELIPLYYQVRGWENETGFPKAEILKEYGLSDVADELEEYRKMYFEKLNNPVLEK